MRKFVRTTLAAVLVASACPTRAEMPAGAEAKLKEALESAIAEHTVFLNCTATDTETHPVIRRGWGEMVSWSVSRLKEVNADPALVREFAERTAYDKLIRRDARFGEIIDMCRGDWIKRLTQLKYVLLNVRVSQILEGK